MTIYQYLIKNAVYAAAFKNIDNELSRYHDSINCDIAYQLGWKTIEKMEYIDDYDPESEPPFLVRFLELEKYYNRGIFDYMQAVAAEVEPEPEEEISDDEFRRLIDLELMEDQAEWERFRSKIFIAVTL